MSTVLRELAGHSFREATPKGGESGDPVLLLHGFPESSLMWVRAMEALAGAGRRCIAPDLYCLGDSRDEGPATYERNLAAVDELYRALDLGRVALAVHDWGGFVGLSWACDNPERVSALVISDTGFFADGRWHGVAEAVRGEHGEALVRALDREGFAGLLRSDGAEFEEETIDAYWKPFAEGRGRTATLEFYRSMDFEKLARFQGCLGKLGVPTLLLWGADDKFAPIGGAHRFAREIPGSQLIALENTGHFIFDSDPQRTTAALCDFLV